MSTTQTTTDYILEQLTPLGEVSARKMFGEYALYHKGKVVALICDDTLFVKITPEGKAYAQEYYQEGYPYKGAKPAIQIEEEQLQDSAWICKLIEITSEHLPEKKVKNS